MSKLFAHINGFDENEAWGDPALMNGLLVMLMEKIKEAFVKRLDENATFVIHCAYEESGHASNSQHAQMTKNGHGIELAKIGNAVDYHIETFLTFSQTARVMEAILDELQIKDVVGFGIYPDWIIKKTGRPVPGFHLDVRGVKARWGRVKGKYISLSAALEFAEKLEEDNNSDIT